METSTLKQEREQKYIDTMNKLYNANVEDFFRSGNAMAIVSIGLSYPQLECPIAVSDWESYQEDRFNNFEDMILTSFGGYSRTTVSGGYVMKDGKHVKELSRVYNIICNDRVMLESKVKNLREQLFQESILVSYVNMVNLFI